MRMKTTNNDYSLCESMDFFLLLTNLYCIMLLLLSSMSGLRIGVITMSKETLQEYFKRYMVDVRGRSMSTYKHYIDALNNISRNLKAKGLIENDIYEISSLDYLEHCRQALMADAEFVALNTRGNHMYSAGLRNYMNFAMGLDFSKLKDTVNKFDVPVPKPEKIITEKEAYKRSNIVRVQAIELAGHKCEIDNTHITFELEKSGNPYMEGHHAIPLHLQGNFSYSLDVFANVICLCPICHRKIHFGKCSDRKDMLAYLYDERHYRLANCGLKLDKDQFIKNGLDR